MPLTPGTRLGPYEILAPLGAGGMGEVYRARDPRLKRDIAIKVLPDDVASSPERLARFEREATTVAGLNHPNVVVLHSIEEAEGRRFITMELVDGQDLSTFVTPGGLPVAQVLELTIPLLDALVAAHEKGVVHRDLKPANVMVARDGRVKVLDFGLAKPTEPEPGLALSQAATVASPISDVGHVLGTVPYMAPEQIVGGAVDARTDVFAVGIVLYELVAGRRPFTGETHVDVSHAILRSTPEPLAGIRGDLPQDLERVIGECLQKNPRERAQTALDVSNTLRRLRKDLERGESVALARAAPQKVASIAVLPFVNWSASTEDEYFSDGLADELLNVLAKIRGLRVAARTSSFHFKGKAATISEIGHALKVSTVLEGSVRKAGQRVRVAVTLVNVEDGYHLWSETYDRTLEDIFTVQDDIARSVVKELRTTLLDQEPDSSAIGEVKGELAIAAKGRTRNAEAHRLYLHAVYLIDRNTPEDTARAILYLTQAVEMDSDFALAWAELGLSYARQAAREWAPRAQGVQSAREAVERALKLEPDLPEGHAQLGRIRLLHDWDWLGAEASYGRALQLAPGSAEVLRGAALLAHYLGRGEDAIRFYRLALDQDPLSSDAYANLGFVLWSADRPAEAEENTRRAIELAPQKLGPHCNLSMILLARGRSEEALAEALREPNEVWRLWALAIVHHAQGRKADSARALEELVVKARDNSPFTIADVHGARGEADAAFEWLERAYAQRDGGMYDLKISPHLRPLHGDLRWSALVRKMGFVD